VAEGEVEAAEAVEDLEVEVAVAEGAVVVDYSRSAYYRCLPG
jgi:hypothetical protein